MSSKRILSRAGFINRGTAFHAQELESIGLRGGFSALGHRVCVAGRDMERGGRVGRYDMVAASNPMTIVLVFMMIPVIR